MWGHLEVHPPQRPAQAVVGDAALNDLGIHAVLLKLARAIGAREEATLILQALRANQERAGNGGLRKDQTTFTSGRGRMNRPPRRRYSACWRKISSAKFHVSSKV